IRGVESTALHILRIIQEEAMKENSAAVHAQVPVDVATFLLNEKRGDIHSIEARLKVNVVLIPNIHLETPHYSIERLRHDDLNLEGALPASYNLVDVPAEERAITGAKEERAVRPQAAVRGVTPEQPAPHATVRPAPAAAEAARPGIINRIFGWFRRADAPAAPTVPANPAANATGKGERGRSDARRDRQGGRERGQERQRDRQQRGDRTQQGRTQEAGRTREAREPREQREPRENRDKRNEPRQQANE